MSVSNQCVGTIGLRINNKCLFYISTTWLHLHVFTYILLKLGKCFWRICELDKLISVHRIYIFSIADSFTFIQLWLRRTIYQIWTFFIHLILHYVNGYWIWSTYFTNIKIRVMRNITPNPDVLSYKYIFQFWIKSFTTHINPSWFHWWRFHIGFTDMYNITFSLFNLALKFWQYF